MSNIQLKDFINSSEESKGTLGIVEFIIKDRNGNVIDHIVERNIVKISAKEMLSHRLPSSQVWDPTGGTGVGAWVDSEIGNSVLDPNEFSARYMIFGASFDSEGTPLGTNDTRYYVVDSVTGQTVPVRLTPGASNDGGLINAIPILEPDRPLKRVETITFSSTYQPSSSPLVDSDVRALNNVLTLETVLKVDEYNGFGSTANDFFTITEVALIGGRKFDAVAQCGLTPTDLFLQGKTAATTTSMESSLLCNANGTTVVSIDPTETDFDWVKKGDQIKIVASGSTQDSYTTLDQVNSHYLIVNKFPGGRDLELDRVPVTDTGSPITGAVGIFKDTLRLFSQRILSSPVRKSASFEITVRWNIIFN